MGEIKRWTATAENSTKNDMRILSEITRIPMRPLIDEAISDLLQKYKAKEMEKNKTDMD